MNARRNIGCRPRARGGGGELRASSRSAAAMADAVAGSTSCCCGNGCGAVGLKRRRRAAASFSRLRPTMDRVAVTAPGTCAKAITCRFQSTDAQGRNARAAHKEAKVARRRGHPVLA